MFVYTNGANLKCDCCITVQICVGGTEMSQDLNKTLLGFILIKNVSESMENIM